MEPIKINLATFEYQDKRISYPVMLVSALIILLISILSIRTGISTQGEIKEYEAKIAKQEQNVVKRQHIKKEDVITLKEGEVESLKKDADFINRLITTDAYPYDKMMDSLEVCVPQGVVLLSFKMSKDLDKVILGGKADSMDKINILLNKLNDSTIYKNNNLMNLSVGQEKGTQGDETSIDNAITFEIESAIDRDKVWTTNPG